MQEDDNDEDFEDCEEGDESVLNLAGGTLRAKIEYLDEDEELLEECEVSPQEFNVAFMQAMLDHKKTYPQGW